MAYAIRTHSLASAHEIIIKRILERGEIVLTEDGEKTIELPEPSILHIAKPFTPNMVSEFSMFKEKAMDKYVQDLLYGSENEFTYTYHERLFTFPRLGIKADDGTIDQIAGICSKLLEARTSRRAQAVTWQPEKDANSASPPCLQRVQCLIRPDNEGNLRLNMHVEFRSNDMLSALGANMFALAHLQKHICMNIGVHMGWYSHASTSPHIYYVRDEPELLNYAKGLGLMDLYKQVTSGEREAEQRFC